MPDADATNHSLTDALVAALKSLAGSWASYSALGSFALYVTGYLALRFHLTALGVATDLAVVDERYVFTGARFVIYLVAALPAIVLCAAPLAALLWIVTRVAAVRRVFSQLADPAWLATYGIFAAVLLIQLVMRQCFSFGNLLLAECLPEPTWMRVLLTDASVASLYFIGLVAGMMLTGGLWWLARRREYQTTWSRGLTTLLATLIVLQCLLLPVNYGVLIVDKAFPRVADLGGTETLSGEQQAWLVWEGDKTVTWLVQRCELSKELVTTLKADVKKTRVLRYDSLERLLTSNSCYQP